MKLLSILLLVSFFTGCSSNIDERGIESTGFLTGPIYSMDIGTYVVLDQKYQPTQLFYRLSIVDNDWFMEGKQPASNWVNISCGEACNYKVTSPKKINKMFSGKFKTDFNLNCIHNKAQAFCRYRNKSDDKQIGYLIAALVTKKPTLIFLELVRS